MAIHRVITPARAIREDICGNGSFTLSRASLKVGYYREWQNSVNCGIILPLPLYPLIRQGLPINLATVFKSNLSESSIGIAGSKKNVSPNPSGNEPKKRSAISLWRGSAGLVIPWNMLLL